MIYETNENLANFHFWAGGKDNAEKLTWDELDQQNTLLEGLWERVPTDMEINDLFWFDFEFVCEELGYKYDIDNDKVIR